MEELFGSVAAVLGTDIHETLEGRLLMRDYSFYVAPSHHELIVVYVLAIGWGSTSLELGGAICTAESES